MSCKAPRPTGAWVKADLTIDADFRETAHSTLPSRQPAYLGPRWSRAHGVQIGDARPICPSVARRGKASPGAAITVLSDFYDEEEVKSTSTIRTEQLLRDGDRRDRRSHLRATRCVAGWPGGKGIGGRCAPTAGCRACTSTHTIKSAPQRVRDLLPARRRNCLRAARADHHLGGRFAVRCGIASGGVRTRRP